MKKLLVIDSRAQEREIFRETFCDYELLFAETRSECVRFWVDEHESLHACIFDGDLMEDPESEFAIAGEKVSDRQVPVIGITDRDNLSLAAQMVKLGFADVVHRPLNPEVVRRRVENIISYAENVPHDEEVRDPLTGLYTMKQFQVVVRDLLAAYPDTLFLMLCFDIERFRLVNDLYGKEEGDRLLVYFGQKFLEKLQTNGGVGTREGADRFFVCVSNPRENLDEIAEEVQGWIRDYPIDFKLFFPFGAYWITDHGMPVNLICDRAAMALNTVKGNYLRHHALYDESMRDSLIARQEVLNDMEQALREERFEVFFQQVYSLQTETLAGAEALVRWRHPGKGLLPPGEFIPIFEDNGFIVKLDAYVREKVCGYLGKWKRQGLPQLPVAVNLSRLTTQNERLDEELAALVKKCGIAAGLLHLEITESIFADEKSLAELVCRLRGRGFQVSMDDFGSGYSTFNLLKDFEIDTLKLDMKFLEGYETNVRAGNIISSVIGLAKTLHMSVIMEGVESSVQADFLRRVGCDYAQGYYFAKALPAESYEKWMEKELGQ